MSKLLISRSQSYLLSLFRIPHWHFKISWTATLALLTHNLKIDLSKVCFLLKLIVKYDTSKHARPPINTLLTYIIIINFQVRRKKKVSDYIYIYIYLTLKIEIHPRVFQTIILLLLMYFRLG